MDDSVTVVEWGEGMVEQLADAHLEVRIDRRDDDVRGSSTGPVTAATGPLGWRVPTCCAYRPG